MKYGGYRGKILDVNLSEEKITLLDFNENDAENFIGGGGLAAKIVAELFKPNLSPLHEDAPLVFATGPLTGTIVPWSGRHCVAGISPLTHLWGESYSGGNWGKGLKQAGYDALIIRGKAKKKVYLYVSDKKVSIEDASHLKNKDCWQTDKILKDELGDKTKVASIGLAGENIVKFASILNDGSASRMAARCGFGALMGSKNLKAVAVQGSKKVKLYDESRLIESIKEKLPPLITEKEHCLKKARFVFSGFVDDGRHGVENWRKGDLAGFKEALLEEVEKHIEKAKPYLCSGCRTGCVESNTLKGIRQSVWESFAPLGSQLGIIDMAVVQELYDICNRNAIDSISAGGVLSFAMECFEEGIISKKDTDGIELEFGNGEAAKEMLEKICRREGFGEILAEGTKRAAKLIGRRAEEFALHTKGLEIPAHDPRTHNFMALTYATDNRGASHLSASNPRIGESDFADLLKIRFEAEGTAEMVVRRQNYSTLLNSLVLCIFSQAGYAQYYSPENFQGISAKEVNEWFNLATGMNKDIDSMLFDGERIFNLKHIINRKLGLESSEDSLPKRFLTLKRGQGPAANHLPQMDEMIKEYYEKRSWKRNGDLREEKVNQLGLRRFT